MDGFLLIDKPEGCTSREVCSRVGRALGVRTGRRGTRIGHAGTLDPFATGLLIVAVGRATRLLQRMVGHDKRYLVGVQLGLASSTDDITGELAPAPVQIPPGAALDTALRSVVDEVASRTNQIPPAVSAIHIDGTRAWQRVRAGEVVDMPPREVQFHSVQLIDLEDREHGPFVTLNVHCSSGTYMRSLARDIGHELGGSGVAATLRRVESGGMHVDDACSIDDVKADMLRPMIAMVPDLARVAVTDDQALLLSHGRPVPCGEQFVEHREVALVRGADQLLAIGRIDVTPDGCVARPETVFVRPDELTMTDQSVVVST